MLLGVNELLIILIITLTTVTLVNPLILLEGFANLLKRQKSRLAMRRQTEREILALHQKSIEKLEKQLQTEVRAELAKIASKHAQTLAKLEGAIDRDYEDKTRQKIEEATERYLKETKVALTGLVAKAEKKVDEELSQELAKARAEINDYREKRMKEIDAKIATIVEKTIYATLGKSLSAAEHIELIYEALAEAKKEGFFDQNA